MSEKRERPKGAKYRNLYAGAGGVVWYERRIGTRVVDGKRVGGNRLRESTETTDWDEAVAFRVEFERRLGIADDPERLSDVPTLAAFAKRYLDEDTGHLAATTRVDLSRYLAADGPILARLGNRRLDAITPALLREWWALEVEAEKRSLSTGRHFVAALAGIYAYARDLAIVEPEADPVPALRTALRRKGRGKRRRAESAADRNIRPIEDPAAIRRLVAAASAEGSVTEAAVLLMLDAGLRLGEALGLRWGDVAWGADSDDRGRHLFIHGSRPRGGAYEDTTKSGRARRVGLSRRLRASLLRLYRAGFKPKADAFVLGDFDQAKFRSREWRRVAERAGLGHPAMKDLRDTFASQLLTAGVQLGYVSLQLGHADVQVTARHYARWCGGFEYRSPMLVGPGELPADLLARLVPIESPSARELDDGDDAASDGEYSGIVLEARAGIEPA